jgi:hypothetical protein
LTSRLKTVDVLMSRLGDTEEVVRKYESRLSDEDTVPADTTAMQVLQEQLAVRDSLTHRRKC